MFVWFHGWAGFLQSWSDSEKHTPADDRLNGAALLGTESVLWIVSGVLDSLESQ